MAKYKRVLIKLSGEALGDHGRLFDFEQIDRVAELSIICSSVMPYLASPGLSMTWKPSSLSPSWNVPPGL